MVYVEINLMMCSPFSPENQPFTVYTSSVQAGRYEPNLRLLLGSNL